MSNLGYAKGVFDLVKWFVVAAFVLVILNYTVASFFIVSGPSMEPNLHDKSVVIVDRLAYHFTDPARGDLVVVRYPGNPDQTYYVKRVIGLPGEKVTIANGAVYINDHLLSETYLSGLPTEPDMTIQVTAGSYLTLGDNRPVSSDGRAWGAAEKRFILGRVEISVWPQPTIYPQAIY